VADPQELESVRPRLFGLVSEDVIRQVSIPRPPGDLSQALAKIEDVTSVVSDAMDRLGIGARMAGSSLRPLGPGQRVCGPAVTIRYTHHGGDPSAIRFRGERPRLGDRDMYALAQPGDVAVFDCAGSVGASVMGAISARWAKRFGLAGCVVDGAVRDVEGIQGLGIPVWSRGITPNSGNYRMAAVEINGTVGCAGSLVRPGDVIVADSTGVCVIPAESASAVVAEVEQILTAEESVLSAIDAGRAPREMPPHIV
jgi:4-hydroxy-4-methyl-2-oxoglutarate aldolase